MLLRELHFVLQENNSIKWASRWDYILVSMPHTNIQWFRYNILHNGHHRNTFFRSWYLFVDAGVSFFQHHELVGYCPLPVWHGCHDHAENSAQGHCQIQPGGSGKDIMELELELILTLKGAD